MHVVWASNGNAEWKKMRTSFHLLCNDFWPIKLNIFNTTFECGNRTLLHFANTIIIPTVLWLFFFMRNEMNAINITFIVITKQSFVEYCISFTSIKCKQLNKSWRSRWNWWKIPPESIWVLLKSCIFHALLCKRIKRYPLLILCCVELNVTNSFAKKIAAKFVRIEILGFSTEKSNWIEQILNRLQSKITIKNLFKLFHYENKCFDCWLSLSHNIWALFFYSSNEGATKAEQSRCEPS